MKTETIKRLQAVLDASVAAGEIPGGSLSVEEQGRGECYIESGCADIEKGKALRRDNIFRLYSMSKPMTAAAAMALMERGMLDLAEPVSDYLPSFAGQKVYKKGGKCEPVRRAVMVKDLLDMTSGLMYPGSGEAGREVDRIFEELDRRLLTAAPMTTMEVSCRLGQAPLAFQPGKSWRYGTSADVLGAVLEKAAGMKFSEVLRKYLFEPLEMEDTGFFVPEEKRDRLAVTYETGKDGMKPYYGNHLGIINAMDREPAFESGGAGLVSTIDDSMKFSRMLLQEGVYQGRRVLQPGTVRFMTQGELRPCQQKAMVRDFASLTGYSYANLMRVRQSNSSACYPGSAGEYGWDGWLGCYMSNDPERKRSIVFMTQRKDAGMLPVVRKLRNVIYAEG